MKDNLFAKMQRGVIEPSNFSRQFRRKITSFDEESGEVDAEFFVEETYTNPAGFIQGGILTALLDDVMGPALSMSLDANQFAPFLNITTSFVRAARPGKVIASARVVNRGRSVAFLESQLMSPEEKLLATATGTATIVSQ